MAAGHEERKGTGEEEMERVDALDAEQERERTPEQVREAAVCLAASGAPAETDICCDGIVGAWGRAQRLDERARAITYEQVMKQAQRYGLRIVTAGDDQWPTGLDDLHTHDPLALALWVAGQPLVLQDAVTITGARAATAYGIEVAQQLGHDLAKASNTVVTTLSHGIDVAALRGALSADGPAPVVILAEGVQDDRPLRPIGEEQFAREVLQRCSVITEYPPTTRASRSTFEARTRLLATLSLATVVVEAGARSSARLTARWAHDRHRLLCAVPGPVTSIQTTLPHELIASGRAQLVTSARDVIDAVANTVITDPNTVAAEGASS